MVVVHENWPTVHKSSVIEQNCTKSLLKLFVPLPRTGNLVFAAHDKNVDVLKYKSDDGDGKGLEFSHHVSWGHEEAKDEEAKELDVYARFISVQDDLLFIAHFRSHLRVQRDHVTNANLVSLVVST